MPTGYHRPDRSGYYAATAQPEPDPVCRFCSRPIRQRRLYVDGEDRGLVWDLVYREQDDTLTCYSRPEYGYGEHEPVDLDEIPEGPTFAPEQLPDFTSHLRVRPEPKPEPEAPATFPLAPRHISTLHDILIDGHWYHIRRPIHPGGAQSVDFLVTPLTEGAPPRTHWTILRTDTATARHTTTRSPR